MSRNTEAASLWAPEVIGRGRLDEHRWAYAIHAPFDTDAGLTGLLGTRVMLDGSAWEIRGSIPAMPPSSIQKGQVVEVLVMRS